MEASTRKIVLPIVVSFVACLVVTAVILGPGRPAPVEDPAPSTAPSTATKQADATSSSTNSQVDPTTEAAPVTPAVDPVVPAVPAVAVVPGVATAEPSDDSTPTETTKPDLPVSTQGCCGSSSGPLDRYLDQPATTARTRDRLGRIDGEGTRWHAGRSWRSHTAWFAGPAHGTDADRLCKPVRRHLEDHLQQLLANQ